MLRRLTTGSLALLITIAMVATACTDQPQETSSSSGSAASSVLELRAIQELRDRFEQDRGAVRLVILVSPT